MITATATDAGKVFTGGATQYRNLVLADGPVAYWRLNAIPPIDETGRGHNAVIVGSGATLIPGLLSADADPATNLPTGASFSVPDHADFAFGAGSFSFECWGRSSDVSGPSKWLLPIWKGGSSNGLAGFDMETSSGPGNKNFAPGISDGIARKGLTIASYPVNDGRVHHLVAVVDRTAQLLIVYIDGLARGSVDISTVGSVSNAQLLYLSYIGDPWNGDLDEVAIYPSALTAAQVLNHYQAGLRDAPIVQAAILEPGDATYVRIDRSGALWISPNQIPLLFPVPYIITIESGDYALTSTAIGDEPLTNTAVGDEPASTTIVHDTLVGDL